MADILPFPPPRRRKPSPSSGTTARGLPDLQFEPPAYRLEAEMHRLISEFAAAFGVRDCVIIGRPYRRRQLRKSGEG